MIGWWSMMVGCRGDETWALGREDALRGVLIQPRDTWNNSEHLETPRLTSG